MSTIITFPPAAPALKLTRHSASGFPSADNWAATLAEERRRLLEDQEALRERESNLRDYEARLRSLQAEIEARHPAPPVATVRTTAPFVRPSAEVTSADDGVLQAAWEKLHRARELFEADQAHMRDDRVVLRDHQLELKKREEAVAARELRVAEREERVREATRPPVSPEPIAGEHTFSAVTRLTRGPFNMARSVFGNKK